VIQATRSRKMYIKNREIEDKIHDGIVKQLATQMPDSVEGVERLPTDLNLLNQLFYDAAIASSSLDEIRAVLNGRQQIQEPGAFASQIQDSAHADVAQGNQPIKVLIVDDVEVAREAYRGLLRDSSDIRIVGEANKWIGSN